MPLWQPPLPHMNSKPVWKVHHSVVEWLHQTLWDVMRSTIWIWGFADSSANGRGLCLWLCCELKHLGHWQGPGNKDGLTACYFSGSDLQTTWSLTLFSLGTTETHRQLLGGSTLCADFPRWKRDSELICGVNIKSGILIGSLKNKTTCRLLRPNSNAQICHGVKKRIMKQWGVITQLRFWFELYVQGGLGVCKAWRSVKLMGALIIGGKYGNVEREHEGH